MADSVVRPQGSSKKIHSKDEFELCYLRHRYLRRTNYNPTLEEMQPYHKVLRSVAKNTYNTYQSLFITVGMEREDIVSIAKVHLVTFLGLFEIRKDPVKYERFLCVFLKLNTREPTEWDIINKNRAILTLFLKQRMQDLVRICRQKAANVTGTPTEEFYAYKGEKLLPPWVIAKFYGNNEKYGYKKIDVATFKTYRKKAKPKNPDRFRYEGFWYIALAVNHHQLTAEELAGSSMDPYDGYHYLNPEQFLHETEKLVTFEKNVAQFTSLPPREKALVFKAFIDENKGNKKFNEEVRIARTMLNKLGKELGNT